MDQVVAVDPVIKRFRERLYASYGERLERAVLFGSRARGDHTDDSDYDVAVFIRDPATRWDEIVALSQITAHFLLEDGVLISAKPFKAGSHHDDTPLMREIRRDGIDL